jgi:hypothetical protein
MATAPIKIVDPPFYDAPIVDDAAGQQHSQAWTEYHQAVADQINKMAATLGVGVTDGSDAVAGKVGEYMTATASGIALVNNTPINVVSLSLTAGDWDVAGNAQFSTGSGQHSDFGVGLDGIDTLIAATFPTTTLTQGMNAALRRYNVTATTTVWLMAVAGFVGSVTASGTIRARRVR